MADRNSMLVAEMREFARFSRDEQAFIQQSLALGLRYTGAVEWLRIALGPSAARAKHLAYRELAQLADAIPDCCSLPGCETFMGPLTRISAQDLAQEKLASFSAYRFLYERLLGARVRQWLPAAFCGAAALPQIRPAWRKVLLSSLSEAAATCPAWSVVEPTFYPEDLPLEVPTTSDHRTPTN